MIDDDAIKEAARLAEDNEMPVLAARLHAVLRYVPSASVLDKARRIVEAKGDAERDIALDEGGDEVAAELLRHITAAMMFYPFNHECQWRGPLPEPGPDNLRQ